MQPSQRLTTEIASAAASFSRRGTSPAAIAASCRPPKPAHAAGISWRSDRVGSRSCSSVFAWLVIVVSFPAEAGPRAPTGSLTTTSVWADGRWQVRAEGPRPGGQETRGALIDREEDLRAVVGLVDRLAVHHRGRAATRRRLAHAKGTFGSNDPRPGGRHWSQKTDAGGVPCMPSKRPASRPP